MKWFSLFILSIFLNMQMQAQVKVIDLKQYQQMVQQDNDTLYIVNFWATWCGPCVKELPHFMALQKKYAQQTVSFLFVSLDDVEQIKKVHSFVSKKKWNMNTVLLDAGDPNVWINAIEPSWQGSIPVTILYKQGVKTSFREQYFDSEEALDHLIQLHK